MPTDSSKYRISGFVLAGGSSTRLHRDKVLLPWKHKTLIDYATDRLRPLCETVRVCANRDDLEAYRPLVRDALPNAGPLAAIVAGLEQSHTEWNLFLAVDLPLLPRELLQALIAQTSEKADALCILPRLDGMPQPLCGLYRRSLATDLRRALEEGKYKIMLALDAIAGTRMERLDVRELARVRIQSSFAVEDWFLNVNTPEDWQRALKLGRELE